MLPVEQPIKTYTGLDGKPLENGFVYFGQPDLNPITNPVSVFWDAAGTIPAAQPIRTVGGYIVRAGTPANVYFDGNYSQIVLDSKKRQVLSAPNSATFAVSAVVAGLFSDEGASLVGFAQGDTGSAPRSVQSKLRDTVSVKDFGAEGDGITDDTAACQRALDSGAATVVFPKGYYILSGTLRPAPGQTLQGMSYPWNLGTVLFLKANINAPMIAFTNGGKICHMSLIGSATEATPEHHLVYINNTNKVILDSLFLANGFHSVHIDGTSFYISLRNLTFDNAYQAQLYVDSDTAPGVDLIMSHCRFLGLVNAPYVMFFKGLGSLIASDIQCSVNSVSGATLWLDDPAPRFGGLQMTNVVLENGDGSTGPAVYIRGASRPWSNLRFVNAIINGASENAVKIANAQTTSFITSNLISTNPSGAIYIPASGMAQVLTITDTNFDGDAGIAPIQCAAPVSISGRAVGCYWGGSAPFIDFSNAGVGQITAFDVIGGSLGSNTAPVRLTQPVSVPGVIDFGQGWTPYEPSLAVQAGSFAAASAQAAYFKRGKTVLFHISIAISGVGSASGYVAASLPAGSVVKRTSTGHGRDITGTGKMLQGLLPANGNVVQIFNYDGSTPAVNGSTLVIEGMFENL